MKHPAPDPRFFTIVYSDREITRPVAEWTRVAGEDVQYLTVGVPGAVTSFQAASLYWLYWEDDTVVVGSGSVRYDPNPLTEILIARDGKQTERKREFFPDLRLPQVKLGWWKHG